MMLRIRFNFGLSRTDAATITEEIAKIIEAIKILVGLSRIFLPVSKLSIFPGV